MTPTESPVKPTRLSRLSRNGQCGAIVAETVAAIAVIGSAILIAGSLLNLQPLANQRLDARRDLLRAAEATIEGVRSGAVPLENGRVRPLPISIGRQVRVTLEVRAVEPPGLYEIAATARTEIRDRELDLRLTSRIWRSR